MATERKELAALKTQLAKSGARWQAADNPIARLSAAEIRSMLGADPPPDVPQLEARETYAATRFKEEGVRRAAGAPATWDWRNSDNKNFIGKIRNQKNCGSCVAFGVVATVEAAIRVKRNAPDLAVELSEAHLFYCHGAADGRNCNNGWWPDRALQAFKNDGVVDGGCFPYTAGDQACAPCADWRNRLTKISAWRSLTNTSDMKSVIATQGPLISCFTVYDDFPSYHTGIYHRVSNMKVGGHCICIVGYDDTQSCWIAKNSWGDQWGEAGFFRIRYGEVGIDYEMWAVEVPAETDASAWLERRLITGLWINHQGHSAAAYIDGVGWKKIVSGDSDVFAGMLTLLASAKSNKSLCNLRLDGGVIREIYVF